MTKRFFKISIAFIAGSFLGVNAQDNRNITTAVPFLQVSADARSAGLGDQGVATTPDAFSQQWNSSKYAFADREMAVALNVTPYLSKLVNDIILANLVGYKRLADGRSAVAVGFRYFSLGDIDFTDNNGNPTSTQRPNELTLDVSYALKLNDNFSMSVAGRYLRSDLRLQNVQDTGLDASAGNSFGVDVTGFYQSRDVNLGNVNGRWRAGFAFSNIGPKLKYSNDEESFIPTNLRVGGGFDFDIDAFNKIRTSLEFSKLLVPSPQVDGSEQDQSSIGSIFSSFNDAQGGFSEELEEVTASIGAEYIYNDVFALRLGYFNEHENKGARKFVSVGAGFKYTSIGIDMSYLFSTSDVPSPLEGTLRFGLTFAFGDEMRDF